MDQQYATMTTDADADSSEPTASAAERHAAEALEARTSAPAARTAQPTSGAPAEMPHAVTPAPAPTTPVSPIRQRCAVMAIAEKARPRPLRRDAERNRLLILSAAKTVFAQRGLDASLDEVAKEAGLGVGTVYRRFPNRDALIDALFADGVSSIERIIEEALAMPRAWDGLEHFMAAMLESQAMDKGLRDVIMSRHAALKGPDDDFVRTRIQPALYELVGRAHEAGDLRTDVAATDIGVLEVAALGIVEFSASAAPDVWRRYLSIILDGLRARPAGGNGPLAQPPLDDDQVEACMYGWKYGSREAPRQRPKPG